MPNSPKPLPYRTPWRSSTWNQVKYTVHHLLKKPPTQSDKVAHISRRALPGDQELEEQFQGSASEWQMQHAMNHIHRASRFTLETRTGPVEVLGWKLGDDAALEAKYYWLIYTDDPAWRKQRELQVQSLLIHYLKRRYTLLDEQDHTEMHLRLSNPTPEGQTYLALTSEYGPAQPTRRTSSFDYDTIREQLAAREKDLVSRAVENLPQKQRLPRPAKQNQLEMPDSAELHRRIERVHNMFGIPVTSRQADLVACGIRPTTVKNARRSDQARKDEREQVIAQVSYTYGIQQEYLEADENDTETRLAPQNIGRNVAIHVLHLAEAHRAARIDKENVHVWLVRSPCKTEDVGDLSIVWSREHPHVQGATVYTHTGESLWDAGDNGPEWSWDPAERIEFKALCLLIQASGLPFTGLDCPRHAQETVMPVILRHQNTRPLDLAALLNEYEGVNEQYIDEIDGTRTSVAEKFEKFKEVAPEEFRHLSMPKHFTR